MTHRYQSTPILLFLSTPLVLPASGLGEPVQSATTTFAIPLTSRLTTARLTTSLFTTLLPFLLLLHLLP